MKRFLQLACLLLACLLMVGTLTACDLAAVMDEVFSEDYDGRGDRYEDDEEDEYETKKPVAENTEGDEETNSLGRPEETAPWGDSWGETETELHQTEQVSSDDPFKDPFGKDEPSSEKQQLLDKLAQYNLDGIEFTVYCNEYMAGEMIAEEIEGAPLNDATYECALLLEESCNLNWVVRTLGHDVMDSEVSKSIMAGIGDFHLIDAPVTSTLGYVASGFLYGYADLGLEDLSSPWWDQGTAEFFVNGQIYFMAGAGNTYHNDVTYAVFCNKNLYDEFSGGQSDLYDVVLEGMWTLDKMEAYAQGCYIDLNGNAKQDEGDRYGFSTYTGYANTFFVGSGLRYVEPDAAGVQTVVLSTEKLNAVGTRISTMYNHDSTFVTPAGEGDLALNAFLEGRSMFYGGLLGHAWDMQDSEVSVGILPAPKFDVEQTEYKTWAAPVASVLSVPVSAHFDIDMLGVILEGYEAASYLLVKPVYCETLLKERTQSMPEAFDVLDLILDNRVYDYGLINGNESFSCFENGVVDGNVIARYKSVEKLLAKQLDKFLESAR